MHVYKQPLLIKAGTFFQLALKLHNVSISISLLLMKDMKTHTLNKLHVNRQTG